MVEVANITKEEYQVIKGAFDSLYQKIEVKLTEQDKIDLNKAFEIAYDGHKNQRRKSGEPYINHPIEVARICYDEIGLGPTAVICAILHDVVEDTPYTQEDIVSTFGPRIGQIVDGLTKLDGLYNTESAQAENFKKVLSNMVKDVRVVLIKMSDRLHNLRTIGSMPRHKQLKIAAETSFIYAPLAHRLGLYKVKTEFEDINLKINEPEVYQDLEDKIQSSQEERDNYIQSFLDPVKSQLDDLEVDYRVLGRPKAISSILNKIRTKKVEFEEIYDLFAVRIIVDVPIEKEKTSCWQIYSIITDVYKPIPERLKDWITTPKGNGYESLHTTVIGPNGRFVEVQVRTERMDDIAERGFAAHWKYKGVKEDSGVYDKWLNNVRDILDSHHSSDALEFINDFKTNLFSQEVYVFTPDGDMRILPKGATALDFAFEIHSEVGYHAIAIKVNNKLVPMGHILENGDQIHVVTQSTQKPTEDWLKLVITGKARSKIRSSMKEEMRKKGEFGKEALQRKLKNMKIDFDKNVDFLVQHYGFSSRPDFYYSLSKEEINLSTIKEIPFAKGEFYKEKIVKPVVDIPEEKIGGVPDKVKKNTSGLLIDSEPADIYDFELAQCCQPVNGDLIFGYLSADNKLKIHRTNCKNATHLLANYGYRVLKAEWTGQRSTSFVVELLITGIDSGPGVIQSLIGLITDQMGINIRSFNINGLEGYFEGRITIFVLNKDQLNLIIQNVKNLDGIQNVKRIDE